MQTKKEMQQKEREFYDTPSSVESSCSTPSLEHLQMLYRDALKMLEPYHILAESRMASIVEYFRLEHPSEVFSRLQSDTSEMEIVAVSGDGDWIQFPQELIFNDAPLLKLKQRMKNEQQAKDDETRRKEIEQRDRLNQKYPSA